ncbi:MAG: hypothetical protein IJ968_09390 [Clostridia bacterium]|nr:hypothetical protein [Clostridia bacterium]
MKKALVLAGGFPQIALIEELKKRDVWTVLADWNENPVARKHADAFYQASTLDVEAGALHGLRAARPHRLQHRHRVRLW